MNTRPGRILALIPAKEGSRRLPAKNILPLAGMTLLERTIRAARKAGLFQRISVSTESEKVAAIARQAGVEMPFMRPAELARDPAGVVEVALHALDEWERRGEAFDTLVILLPTSPFRQAADITGAMETYLRLEVDFLMSVVREVHSPLASLVRENERLLPLHPEWLNRTGARATAAAPDLVRCNGAVTVVDVARFRKERNYYAYPLGAYEMPVERSLDIDTELEFAFAEFLAERHPEWLDA
ncbi:MAG: acylneuraminate cytidylyltransferase family protein [Hydrogenophilaceae bacterium]|nr:acylneuraminate cytidylyltransferase family protein [Hydrogenophilaceae bacterium]